MGFTSLALTVVSAGAIHTPHEAPADLRARSWLDVNLRVGTRLDSGDDDTFVFISTELDALLRAGPGHVMLGLAASSFSQVDDHWTDVWALANPFLGYTLPIAPEARLVIGVALPLLDIEENDDVFAGAAGVLNANARRPWTWSPSTLSLIAGVDVASRFGDAVTLDADLRVGVMVPTNDEVQPRETAFVADVEAGLRYGVGRVGLGFVFLDGGDDDILSLGGDDAFRFTASLGLRVPVGQGTFYADLTLGLDDPGLFDDEAVPSLMLGWTSPL